MLPAGLQFSTMRIHLILTDNDLIKYKNVSLFFKYKPKISLSNGSLEWLQRAFFKANEFFSGKKIVFKKISICVSDILPRQRGS